MKKKISKKVLKEAINKKGFWNSMKIDLVTNAPAELKEQIPEGATYFEGIVSNGELNRNGYIIRPEALKNSLDVFMSNPVILLMHNTTEPIGRALSAEVRPNKKSKDEVFVRGYVYDDLTGGRFSRNLFKALSTGHITLEREFENTKTGEVLSEEEFRKFNWEEQYNGDWVVAVTKLEWVEFSLVSIGSNRKSLVTKQNAIEAVLKNKFNHNGLIEVIEENGAKNESKEEEPANAETPAEPTKESPKVEDSDKDEKADEKPATSEEPVEKDGEAESSEASKTVDGNKFKISVEDRQKLQAESDLLLATLAATIAEDEQEKEEEKPVEADEEPEKVQTEALKGENEQEVQTTENKVDTLSPEVKTVIEELLSINHALDVENKHLQAQLAAIPNKRGLMRINKPVEANKPTTKEDYKGQKLLNFLRESGVSVG